MGVPMTMKARVLLQVALALGAVGALQAAPAVAAGVQPGQELYIKTRNTRVLADPSPSAKVLIVLQPGEKVKWQGPDAADRRWHRIEAGAKKGVVLAANLSTAPPKAEITASTGPAAKATNSFLSSGAATKALGAGAIEYAKVQKSETSARQIQRLEQLAKSIGPREVAEHARKAGLSPAVGAAAGTGAQP